MTLNRVINILSALIMAAIVFSVTRAIFDAPAWGAVGFAVLSYQIGIQTSMITRIAELVGHRS